MFPKATIRIDGKGRIHLESDEKSDQCFKFEDLAKKLGKVTSVEKKEHTPVFHDVNQKV
jgi:hypothetical protein